MDELKRFVYETRKKPDVRLAILSGLRSYAEPGSTQTLVSLGSMYVSLAAIAATFASFGGIWSGMPLVAVSIVILAFIGYGIASKLDERRRFATVWLPAYEDALRDEPRRR